MNLRADASPTALPIGHVALDRPRILCDLVPAAGRGAGHARRDDRELGRVRVEVAQFPCPPGTALPGRRRCPLLVRALVDGRKRVRRARPAASNRGAPRSSRAAERRADGNRCSSDSCPVVPAAHGATRRITAARRRYHNAFRAALSLRPSMEYPHRHRRPRRATSRRSTSWRCRRPRARWRRPAAASSTWRSASRIFRRRRRCSTRRATRWPTAGIYYTSALGIPELRQAIARHYARPATASTIAPERVIVTAGSSAALLLVMALLVDRDDRILLSDPGLPLQPPVRPRARRASRSACPVGADDRTTSCRRA